MAGSRWVLVPAAALTVVAALALFYVAGLLRLLDCDAEYDSECSTEGLVQLVIAGFGLVPALGMLALAVWGRGRPWRWFLATVLVYAAWVASWFI
jgi:hypothetical protein